MAKSEPTNTKVFVSSPKKYLIQNVKFLNKAPCCLIVEIILIKNVLMLFHWKNKSKF